MRTGSPNSPLKSSRFRLFTWKPRWAELILVAVTLIGCGILWFVPTGFEDNNVDSVVRVRAEVVEADDSTLIQSGLIVHGEQRLTLKILEGSRRGEMVQADNVLLGDLQIDNFHRSGDQVLVTLNLDGDQVAWTSVAGPYRLGLEAILCVMFAVVLVAVAGWTGVKALISFVFAGLMIWKVLVPLFLRQYNPILVALGVVAVLTAAVTFLVGGLNRRGLTAFLGGMLGLILTCLMALAVAGPFHLTGASLPFAKATLQRVGPTLDLSSIFLAGVFIASSGAVMDLAMDVSAAMGEIAAKRPDISRFDLALSGLRVGRAVIGTMTTTLLLAYSGGYVTLLMYFMAQGVPPEVMVNGNLVAPEILKVVVGSFGLVTVAPFTAVVGAFVQTVGANRNE